MSRQVQSQFYKYSKLVTNNTPYSKKMENLSHQIFGQVTRTTGPNSLKVVDLLAKKPLCKRGKYNNYYPRHPEIYDLVFHLRNYGLYRDEHLDFQEEIARLATLRGKGKKPRPPSKLAVNPFTKLPDYLLD